MINSTTHQAGWTLVEMAMVFIVITILVGGILKANEMITNTKLKKIKGSAMGLIAAKNLYYDRYRQFPGDDPDASDHFSIYSGMPEINGDGDGIVGDGTDWDVDEATPLAYGEQETLKFFMHLRAAKFIAGNPLDQNRPNHTLGDGGEIGVQDGSLEMYNPVIIFSNIDGSYIRILDTWHDDGDLSSGNVRGAAVGDGMDSSDTPSNAIIQEEKYHMAWEMPG